MAVYGCYSDLWTWIFKIVFMAFKAMFWAFIEGEILYCFAWIQTGIKLTIDYYTNRDYIQKLFQFSKCFLGQIWFLIAYARPTHKSKRNFYLFLNVLELSIILFNFRLFLKNNPLGAYMLPRCTVHLRSPQNI